jgi:restriction endonuclease Mrr
MGGSAPVEQVLDRVGEKMKAVLNDYDRQSLPSYPNTVRWRNNVQWCRNSMVQEGLMKADSPRGVWEITDSGKEALKREQV